MRSWNRLSCSSSLTENQYLISRIPERRSIRSNSGQERRNSWYSSFVQKPITRSTPARLYQLRSNRHHLAPDGRCADVALEVPLRLLALGRVPSATMLAMRGLSRSTMRLITPPLPAASRPSKSTQTFSPSCLIPLGQLHEARLGGSRAPLRRLSCRALCRERSFLSPPDVAGLFDFRFLALPLFDFLPMTPPGSRRATNPTGRDRCDSIDRKRTPRPATTRAGALRRRRARSLPACVHDPLPRHAPPPRGTPPSRSPRRAGWCPRSALFVRRWRPFREGSAVRSPRRARRRRPCRPDRSAVATCAARPRVPPRATGSPSGPRRSSSPSRAGSSGR